MYENCNCIFLHKILLVLPSVVNRFCERGGIVVREIQFVQAAPERIPSNLTVHIARTGSLQKEIVNNCVRKT